MESLSLTQEIVGSSIAIFFENNIIFVTELSEFSENI